MPLVEIEPRTSRFGVQRSTTTPPWSLLAIHVCRKCGIFVRLNSIILFLAGVGEGVGWGGGNTTIHLLVKKVRVGNNQEKAQSERDSHSKNRGEKKK